MRSPKYQIIKSQDQLGGEYENPIIIWEGSNLRRGIRILAENQNQPINGGTTCWLRRIRDDAELVACGPRDPWKSSNAANPCELAWSVPGGNLEEIGIAIRWSVARMIWPE